MYLAKFETGTRGVPPIPTGNLDSYLSSHFIDPAFLRTDNFEAFMRDRQRRLLALIEKATGKAVYRDEDTADGAEAEKDDEAAEAELTMAA